MKKMFFLFLLSILMVQGGMSWAQQSCNLTGQSASTQTYPSIFKDAICSGLNPGVTQASINAMPNGFYKSLAQCMYNGTYDVKYRVQSYRPYETRETLKGRLKTAFYSLFENPTGISFDANTSVVVFVEDTYGQDISLIVHNDLMEPEMHKLVKGLNTISIQSQGLGYISYFSDDYKTLSPVRINITGGKVNGYYDLGKTSATQWQYLLQNAVDKYIDIRGKYVTMCCTVNELRLYCGIDAKPLVEIYDEIVRLEWEYMGFFKYNIAPDNHMHMEFNNNSYSDYWMDDEGAHIVGFCHDHMNPDNAIAALWAPAHELGHTNQIRPYINWIGTAEVTVNFYSNWVNLMLAKSDQQKAGAERQMFADGYYPPSESGLKDGEHNDIIGGFNNAFLNNAILKGQRWSFIYSYESVDQLAKGKSDPFIGIIPFRILQLYYGLVLPEKKDWYADICEKYRHTDEPNMADGKCMINFMKNTCDAVGEDLTDYFAKVGMLRTFNDYIYEYRTSKLLITAEDSASVRAYVASKGYPKPQTPVLHYLSYNNHKAFQYRLAVEGAENVGCTPYLDSAFDLQKYVEVDHSAWKNAVAFETYSGDKLIRISAIGSGHEDASKTNVYYPSNASAIYAMAWDGSKKLVFSSTPSTPAPQIFFKASKFMIPVGGKVSFQDISLYEPTSWNWTFDGGTPSSSSAKEAIVYYNTPGIYKVTLQATNAVGSTTLTRDEYITVTDDIALDKPTIASSVVNDPSTNMESDLEGSSKANDGDKDTYWKSNANGSEWLQIDLENVYNINRVVFDWLDVTAPRDFSIQVSMDGQTWNTIKSIVGNSQPGTWAHVVQEYTGLSGTGRYIRMLGISPSSPEYNYHIWGFNVYGTLAVNDNLAANKPVTVSSVLKTGYEGSKAVDRNMSTYWSSKASNSQWIKVDLQNNYTIDKLVLKWGAGFGKDFTIQFSTDQVTWTTVKTITGNVSLTNEFTGLSNDARYIRISCTKRGTTRGYELSEIEAYGKSSLKGGDLTTGIIDIEQENIQVYPNPSSSSVNINLGDAFDSSEEVVLHLFDITGKEMMRKELNSERFFKLSLEDFPKDQVYILHFSSKMKHVTKKIILKK